MSAPRDAIALVALSGVGGLALIAAVFAGPVAIPVADVLAALVFQNDDPAVGLAVREVRAPRALTAFLVGAALGLAGAAMQGLLRNPLADPGVLGVSASAVLGAVTAVYFGLAEQAGWTPSVFAIVFALTATAALYALGANAMNPTTLILVGVGLSSFAGALTALAMNLAPNPFSLSDLVNWLLGSVANRNFADLAPIAPLIAIGVAVTLAAGRGLQALTLGEEAAVGIGANLTHTRLLAIGGAALLTGAAVALAGAVGFVGVVAAHVVRPFFGHDPARILLPSALVGGAMLTLADLAVRLAPFPQELKLGVAAALIGAPAFVYIAARTTERRA